MPDLLDRPQPIRTDTSNPFANNTMRVRVPDIIRDVQALNPDYPAAIHADLDRLHDEIQGNARIPMLELPAPDYESWAIAYAPHAGERWHGSEWFFAEVYFYRLLMQAVRWFETGRDPFAPKKDEEFANPALWQALEAALDSRGQPLEQRLPLLILEALWGNRIDLSFAAALAHGRAWTDEDLLVGHHEQAAERLLSARGDVHVIHDNAGSELAVDLALVDALLEDGAADRVVLHLKWHPTFVSDATLPDLHHFLRLLASGAHGPDTAALARRLEDAFLARRLRYAPDPFWNSTRFLWDLPPHLHALFEGASLVVVKGDANYRRVVGDALWPTTAALADVVAHFPAPLLLMRTMKSDPVVGLPAGMEAQLDALDSAWRVNGRRGLIQLSSL